MAVVLSGVQEAASTGSQLVPVTQDGAQQVASHGNKRLAVCLDSQQRLVLARESQRPVIDAAGKRPKKDEKGVARKREAFWQQTAALADWRDATLAGLIAI